jgi:hypothetical protein
MKKISTQSGYVGLLALLISVAIIGILMIRFYAKTDTSLNENASKAQPLEALKQAENLKDALEKESARRAGQE